MLITEKSISLVSFIELLPFTSLIVELLVWVWVEVLSSSSHSVIAHADAIIHHVHIVGLPWLSIELVLNIDSAIELLHSILVELLCDLWCNHLLNLLEVKSILLHEARIDMVLKTGLVASTL